MAREWFDKLQGIGNIAVGAAKAAQKAIDDAEFHKAAAERRASEAAQKYDAMVKERDEVQKALIEARREIAALTKRIEKATAKPETVAA